MRKIYKTIVNALAIYSKFYLTQGSFLSRTTLSALAAQKYISNPEERAAGVVNVLQNATPKLLKSFWSITEKDIANGLQAFSMIPVCRVITVIPEEFSINVEGRKIEIPMPSSHIGNKPIKAHLISYTNHEGMIGTSKSSRDSKPPARGLIIYCHGGGFLALTSRSFLVFLKVWAKEIGVPILSIDYTLSLEAPYPRALEEAFYVYCWAMQNSNSLGSTGERIILTGDSAGGNLIMGITLQCIKLGIPLPSGLCPIYSCFGSVFKPSPGRLLSLIEPLIPFTFTLLCIKAYIYGNTSDLHSNGKDKPKNGSTSETIDNNKEDPKSKSETKNAIEKVNSDAEIKIDFAKLMQFPEPAEDPFLFPIHTDDDDLKKYPIVKSVAGELDPFIDDNVALCKKLKRMGNDVTLDVLPNLGHGFLNFSHKSKECYEGCQFVIKRLLELLNLENLPPIEKA